MMIEDKYNQLYKQLSDWYNKHEKTYELKGILSPTHIPTDGEVVIILTNEVTVINVIGKTVIKNESKPFRYNLYSDEPFSERLQEFTKNFDKQFYGEVDNNKNGDAQFLDL